MGGYEVARQSDAYWLYTYTPAMSSSWGMGVEDLVNGLRATWTFGVINPYDQPQWALIYLFQGSMMVFAALLITLNLTPFYRGVVLSVFALWSFDLSYKFRDRESLFPFLSFPGCSSAGIPFIFSDDFELTTLPQPLSALPSSAASSSPNSPSRPCPSA